jgi:NAD(P)-dependent dehydrogenase (short-subunit alcohol dehydrogenase family)
MKDDVVIVTGASSGIGRATALAFARGGAKLSLSDVNEAGGAETLSAVRAAGAEALFTTCDVTDERAVTAMVAKTVERFGRLDSAFNNAGIENDPKPLGDIDAAAFDRVIATNVRGVYLCMKAEIPAMLKRGKGAIVNTASVAGLVGAVGLSPYVASKHAVVGLTKSASAEYARMGLRINAVCPGLTCSSAWSPPWAATRLTCTSPRRPSGVPPRRTRLPPRWSGSAPTRPRS